MDIFRAAVIGCGNISSVHFDALKKNNKCVIAAVCDIIKERADKKASEYNAKAFYNIDDMLEWNQFDVLHICTPHYLHFPMAVSAMNKGKHVLCEKPPAIKYHDAVKMSECAAENKVHLGVCFQNRYNAQSVYIKSIIDSGELGDVKAVKGIVTWDRRDNYFNADDWHGTLDKEGGGVAINQALHTIDLMQWFAGSDIESVKATISRKRFRGKIETEDTADAVFEFKNGVTAMFFGSLCFAENSPVFLEIICEKGKIVMYDELNIYRNGKEKETVTFKKASGEKSYWGSSHKLLIDDFYGALSEGRKFSIDGSEGSKAVKIVSAIYDDAENNNG